MPKSARRSKPPLAVEVAVAAMRLVAAWYVGGCRRFDARELCARAAVQRGVCCWVSVVWRRRPLQRSAHTLWAWAVAPSRVGCWVSVVCASTFADNGVVRAHSVGVGCCKKSCQWLGLRCVVPSTFADNGVVRANSVGVGVGCCTTSCQWLGLRCVCIDLCRHRRDPRTLCGRGLL